MAIKYTSSVVWGDGNFLVNPPVTLNAMPAAYQEWGKAIGGRASLETGFQWQIRESTGSSRETYVWTLAKNLASLRSVGWQASCSGNSRLKSGGGKIPSADAEGKFSNIYLAAFNSEQLGLGESHQNDPLKTAKSSTLLCALLALPLFLPPLRHLGKWEIMPWCQKPKALCRTHTYTLLGWQLRSACAFAISH